MLAAANLVISVVSGWWEKRPQNNQEGKEGEGERKRDRNYKFIPINHEFYVKRIFTTTAVDEISGEFTVMQFATPPPPHSKRVLAGWLAGKLG